MQAVLAMPIFAVARSMPMLLTNRPIFDKVSAKERSAAERTFERAALALSLRAGSVVPAGLRQWSFDISTAWAVFFSFFWDLSVVSARTFDPLLALSGRPPSSRPA